MSKRITEQDKDANPITKPETDYQDADGNVPVDADAPIAEPNEEQANSDAQLQQDDKDAIDKSNIISSRTRGAKPAGGFKEPSEDDEDLLAEDEK